jgi:hypothetical protein
MSSSVDTPEAARFGNAESLAISRKAPSDYCTKEVEKWRGMVLSGEIVKDWCFEQQEGKISFPTTDQLPDQELKQKVVRSNDNFLAEVTKDKTKSQSVLTKKLKDDVIKNLAEWDEEAVLVTFTKHALIEQMSMSKEDGCQLFGSQAVADAFLNILGKSGNGDYNMATPISNYSSQQDGSTHIGCTLLALGQLTSKCLTNSRPFLRYRTKSESNSSITLLVP